LFRTADLSAIKRFVQKEWQKILQEDVTVQDFIFAKEVKLGSYVPGHEPPGALLGKKAMETDPRKEPEHGERVPYVVLYGPSGSRVSDQVVSPREVVESTNLHMNSEFYITRHIIPVLSRVLNLCGGDVASWWLESSRSNRVRRGLLRGRLQPEASTDGDKGDISTLDQFFHTSSCLVCSKKLSQKPAYGDFIRVNPLDIAVTIGEEGMICTDCSQQKDRSLLTIASEVSVREGNYTELLQLCNTCMGGLEAGDMENMGTTDEVRKLTLQECPCRSLDCQVYYERWRARQKLDGAVKVSMAVDNWYQQRR